MRAAVRHEYGGPDVLRVEEVPTPEPRDDEVLLRVRAASVNLGDWELLTGRPRYITTIARVFAPRPRTRVTPAPGKGGPFSPKYRILGCDVAGQIERVGGGVTQFSPGEEVFGDCAIAGFGGFAEYVCLPERAALVPKPPDMTYEQAAAIPQAAFIALKGLRDLAPVRAGQHVLVNGAGGGAGTFAVQYAKAHGAEVSGVDGPTKQDLLRSLGADHVIDYTREDYTRNGQRYDTILDLVANRSVLVSRRSLKPGGTYMLAGGGAKPMAQSAFLGPFLSRTGKGKVRLLLADASPEDLRLMVELFEAGKVVPVVDRCYPLEQTGEAIRRLGDKLSEGKVLVTP